MMMIIIILCSRPISDASEAKVQTEASARAIGGP